MPSREHEQADARHVAHREVHVIGHVLRARRVAGLPLDLPVEVLHADRPREVGLDGVVDVPPGQLLEDGAGGVEVPVVVEVVRARLLRAPRRRAVGGVAGVRRRVIDTRPRGDQVLDGRLELPREQPADVRELQLLQRGVEPDRPVLDVLAVQHRQHALAHRREVAEVRDVAVLEEHAPAHGHEHRRRVDRREPPA